ncbi:MAG: hypothetical protein ACO3A4_13230 [Silvanigrellaceae bacterium]
MDIQLRPFIVFAYFSAALTGCISSKSSTVESGSRDSKVNISPERYLEQFEATEFAKCIDEDGKATGSIVSIWRIKNLTGDNITPFIQGFAGKFRTLKGTLLEFQSLVTQEEKRFALPLLMKPELFPRGSYSAYKMRFLEDDIRHGISILNKDGKNSARNDFTTATLYIPRFALGGEFATRYYLRIDDDQSHEMSCQAVTEATRARLSTVAAKDGLHGFTGVRGKKVDIFLNLHKRDKEQLKFTVGTGAGDTSATNSPSLQLVKASDKDLRPTGRPKIYDKIYEHTRIFECKKEGAVDAIWRVADDNGKKLSMEARYITGFAGELHDKMTGNKFSFNAVSVDPAPAFYSGTMPPNAHFFFPSIEFDDDDFKQRIATHSALPNLPATFKSGGGTVFIPRDGSGRAVSVSLSMGKSLRGDPFQATAQCLPVIDKVSSWIEHCLGQENRKTAGVACKPK